MLIKITPDTRAGQLLPFLKERGLRREWRPNAHGNANVQKRPRYAGQFGKARKGVPA